MIATRMLPTTQNGMTLLELLLVVTILSAVAFMSLATVTDNTSQVRYDDTRNRLALLREAVTGSTSLSFSSTEPLGGYVVDNGTLPINIDSLVETPTGYDAFTLVTPQFDPVPGSDGINNGPASGTGQEIELTDARHALLKGHRSVYVSGVTDGEYRDGWGTDRTASGGTSVDCPTPPTGSSNNGDDTQANNHGWCVTSYAGGIYVESYGRDGAETPAPTTPYDTDISMQPPVLSTDWQTVVLAGTDVTIVNETSTDIDFTGWGNRPRVSLLIYRNDDDATNEYNWRRITTGPVIHTCLDGDGLATGLCDSSVDPSTTTAAFTANFNVPAGEHLLVVVHDADGNVNTSDDTPNLPVGFSAQRIKFYPRGSTPAMEIAIR